MEVKNPARTPPCKEIRTNDEVAKSHEDAQWNSLWLRKDLTILNSKAHTYLKTAYSLIQSPELKAMFKATTLLSKYLKNDIEGVKTEASKIRADVTSTIDLFLKRNKSVQASTSARQTT